MSSLLERLSGGQPAHKAVTQESPPVRESPVPRQTSPSAPTTRQFLTLYGKATTAKDGVYRDQGQVVFVVDGYEITLPPFDEHDFYKVEDYLRKNRKLPITALTEAIDAIQAAPEAIRSALLDRAYADLRKTAKVDELSRREVADWLDTRPGVIYSMWIQFVKRYQTITEEDCAYLLTRLSIERAMEARDEALDKNLTELSQAPRK